MNRKYNLKLDLQFRCNNSTMKFNQFDNNTSDFFMKISSGGKSFDVEKAIVVLATIKPSGKVASQFVEIENGLVYADLKPNMVDEIGIYTAQAMLILEDERVVTDVISYEVEEDKIFSLLNDTVETAEEFTMLTDMLSRLSTIETNEEQRVINEAERILSEENRKIEEAKRVEAELIRQHEEADRAKYDATRESNENIRKQNESIRLTNETNRIDEEAKRVEEENKRKLAEEERNANYNFMTEDEDRRRLEANAHKEAEVLRVQAETNRVNEEAKRRTTEQARVSAENTRVSNENTRKASEVTRQTNETQRVEAETQRQSRYNSFIADAEANANNFENYTNTAKVKEEERKSNELDRKSQEDRRVSNEVERISNENTRKANEKAREKNEASRQNTFTNKVNEVDKKIIEINTTKDNFVSSVNTKVDTKISELDTAKSDMTNTVSNKVDEVETRFNALTSSQQQDAEVIDARDGETSLKARLDRDIEKAKQVYVNVEGSHISTDSSSGYAKDVEILGNTIQSASNLADIRSVGDKIEGQELYEILVLSCGKNLIPSNLIAKGWINSDGVLSNGDSTVIKFVKVKQLTNYSFSNNGKWFNIPTIFYYDKDKKLISKDTYTWKLSTPSNCCYVQLYLGDGIDNNVQLEEGTQVTPYEPYQEDKLTILSPVQLEKVGDVRDRIIEKDGVWGVEKNVVTDKNLNELNWAKSNLSNSDYTIFYVNGFSPRASVICNIFSYSPHIGEVAPKQEGINIIGDGSLRISISANKCPDVASFKEYLLNNNCFIKYIGDRVEYKLPHSQQIKLRTFANKTNISFGCEIEGTIKAQVPKSLGATVNTHTEQIRSLNNELNRVKKLEESTVSTVETERDFTTVEATSNGYFEDVKLEGKTLVNLTKNTSYSVNLGGLTSEDYILTTSDRYLKFTKTNAEKNPNWIYVSGGSVPFELIKPNTQYTIKLEKCLGVKDVIFKSGNGINAISSKGVFDANGCALITTNDNIDKISNNIQLIYLSVHNSVTDIEISNIIILEGDHTQNPPSGYIEGLKSVGQSASEDGADEIVVSSVKGDGNLFSGELVKGYLNPTGTIESHNNWIAGVNYIPVKGNCTITFSEDLYCGKCMVVFYDKSLNVITNSLNLNTNGLYTVTTPSNCKYIRVAGCKNPETASTMEEIENIKFMINKGTTPKPYTPHQSDKKRLLYYNEETQTWEKPVLREWDSIEKHANGKYYYHQRSGEVVLNGSEDGIWCTDDYNQSHDITTHYRVPVLNSKQHGELLCTHFKKTSIWDKDIEGIELLELNNIDIRVSRAKLSTQDAQGFKQWLQANNVTVVYQLAEEKVYECTNIDLITYANETNFIVESSALSPKTTLKVHSNISNVVSLLQKKVSLLESNVKASQEVQDMMILETDMRMLDIELALMEFIPMKLNLGGSNMLRSATYFNFLKNHIINETYEKEYLENVMNKYLATGRINQDEYNELYKMLYPPVYDIELPIEY